MWRFFCFFAGIEQDGGWSALNRLTGRQEVLLGWVMYDLL